MLLRQLQEQKQLASWEKCNKNIQLNWMHFSAWVWNRALKKCACTLHRGRVHISNPEISRISKSYLCHSEWDTRIAAAESIEAIIDQVCTILYGFKRSNHRCDRLITDPYSLNTLSKRIRSRAKYLQLPSFQVKSYQLKLVKSYQVGLSSKILHILTLLFRDHSHVGDIVMLVTYSWWQF